MARGPPQLLARRAVKSDGPGKEKTTLGSLLTQFALQDACPALQDSWNPYLTALIGLIGWVRGTVLQNVIADDLRDIMFDGHAILDEMRAAPKK